MSKKPMKKSSGATWLTRFFGGHTDCTDRTFEHELFWTRITRMTRIFLFGTRISLTDLCSRRGAHMGDTRFLNTDVTLYFFWTRITRITRILFLHTDLTDLTDACSRRCAHSFLNTNNTNIFCTRNSLTLLLSFNLLQESLGDVAGGDGT